LTARWASSNVFGECGPVNRSCPNSRCTLRCPEELGEGKERAATVTLAARQNVDIWNFVQFSTDSPSYASVSISVSLHCIVVYFEWTTTSPP
jgi:hypothetical protein